MHNGVPGERRASYLLVSLIAHGKLRKRNYKSASIALRVPTRKGLGSGRSNPSGFFCHGKTTYMLMYLRCLSLPICKSLSALDLEQQQKEARSSPSIQSTSNCGDGWIYLPRATTTSYCNPQLQPRHCCQSVSSHI